MILPDDATPKPDGIFGKDYFHAVRKASFDRRLDEVAQQGE